MLARTQCRGFLNKVGIWFDTSLTSMEQKLALKGKKYSLVELCTRNPALRNLGLLQRLSALLDLPAKTLTHDQVKASDNSLLLFYSDSVGRHLARIRTVDALMIPLILLGTTTWIPVIVYSALCFLHLPLAVSASRMFVVRMELLPHLESILVQKVGFFGLSRTELVPIQNLQRIKPAESAFTYYHQWLGGFNRDVMFRDVETKQEYVFEVNGTWVEENIKHPLIV
jgi:hypothetical protein